MPSMLMKHEVDPKKALFDKAGDLSGQRIMHSHVLLGIYIRPKVTSGGIYLTDNTVDEDRYQGKVGLVLKMGPLAFQDTDDVKFHGQKVEVGDWVVIRSSDGWALNVHQAECRMVPDVLIKMVTDSPDKIW